MPVREIRGQSRERSTGTVKLNHVVPTQYYTHTQRPASALKFTAVIFVV